MPNTFQHTSESSETNSRTTKGMLIEGCSYVIFYREKRSYERSA